LKNNPSPKARAAVGRALGRLQLNGESLDNRKGVSIFTPRLLGEGLGVRSLPDLDWVEIPAGKFIYQEKEQREEGLFYILRYPVTFTQFQIFVEDLQGFANPKWWDGLSADDKHNRASGEQVFKFYNHPRECVSWYDAVAFCRWLTEKAKEHSQLLPEKLAGLKNCEISLPTEWQWEKAARGTDGREYPYKGKCDAEKANTSETGIKQTSAVGIFPQGASPYGVMDMSGNVWEWCLNEYWKPENIALSGGKNRLLRGGSWSPYPVSARASSNRSRISPDLRDLIFGFRLVVRPPKEQG
jgi:formylglycine-generating enzyme required for sulfatase activity